MYERTVLVLLSSLIVQFLGDNGDLEMCCINANNCNTLELLESVTATEPVSESTHTHTHTYTVHHIPCSATFSWNLIFAYFVEFLTSIQRKLFDQLGSLRGKVNHEIIQRNVFIVPRKCCSIRYCTRHTLTDLAPSKVLDLSTSCDRAS